MPPEGDAHREVKERATGTLDDFFRRAGRWASTVLGLDLAVDGGRIRFFYGNAPLLEAAELADKLGKMLDEVVLHKQEAEARNAGLERQLREAQAEIERLKGSLIR